MAHGKWRMCFSNKEFILVKNWVNNSKKRVRKNLALFIVSLQIDNKLDLAYQLHEKGYCLPQMQHVWTGVPESHSLQRYMLEILNQMSFLIFWLERVDTYRGSFFLFFDGKNVISVVSNEYLNEYFLGIQWNSLRYTMKIAMKALKIANEIDLLTHDDYCSLCGKDTR